jgi:hypothetical protein
MMSVQKEIPPDRPDPGGYAAVFVPRLDAGETVRETIRGGSGVAGWANGDGTVTVYFENNRFGDSALEKWESKVFKAYERMVGRLPTTSKLTCDNADLQVIGLVIGRQIVVRNMEALTDWLRRSDALGSAPAGPLIEG